MMHKRPSAGPGDLRFCYSALGDTVRGSKLRAVLVCCCFLVFFFSSALCILNHISRQLQHPGLLQLCVCVSSILVLPTAEEAFQN